MQPHESQSDGQARKRMNGFAEYLSIFSCREASSVVQSQLARKESLNQGPAVFSTRLMYRRKSGWSAAAKDWRPLSVREPGDDRVYCPVLGLDEGDDRD